MFTPRTLRSSALPLLALVLLLPMVSGCAGAALVTLATVADITSGVVSTGADVYKMGKLNSADIARYEECLVAVREAARDMHLKTVEDERHDGKHDIWDFTFRDELNSEIDVSVERRTAALVRIRIDVGLFGSEPTAKLFMARIRYHLPAEPVPATTQWATPPSTMTEPTTEHGGAASLNHADDSDASQ